MHLISRTAGRVWNRIISGCIFRRTVLEWSVRWSFRVRESMCLELNVFYAGTKGWPMRFGLQPVLRKMRGSLEKDWSL